ncbi:MAG: PDZ domain-containing protein [Pseudomonadota bacterium]
MRSTRLSPRSLPAALALALGIAMAGAALAQSAPTPAQQKELDAARAELDKAAQRVAELSRKYVGADGPMRIETRVLRKPVIGVLLAPDASSGVRIAGVTPDSAAAAADLRSGDVITSINGRPLKAGDATARVEEARELLAAVDAKSPVKLGYERDGKGREVALTPKVGDRLMVLPRGSMFDGNVQVFAGKDGEIEVLADRIHLADAARIAEGHAHTVGGDATRHAEWSAAIAPDVRREIIRLGSDCKGDDCKLPALAEAFRWNGLNLATVDAQLGRYFGTTDGVLVLSTGNDLAGLQAGDVIRKIGGKPVDTPRAAMDALRAQPADSKVAVEYLRDRVVGRAEVSVPKALPFQLSVAPRGPMPRIAAFASAAPKAPGAVEKRKFVRVDKNGKTHIWEGDAGDAPPAWVQALPPDGQRMEKRKVVILDKDGKRIEMEEDVTTAPVAPQPSPKRD